ncbi:hypothetical protein [Rhodohalobacter sp. SW132]|uniref:hypothetical protein n=2 Tax=Rhodohalobacter sp. SW132 TaxID=2293433 RepID=UPI001AE00467|nr:hypothetical protein [Rhodohalobacter sp. SW132]
MGKKSLIFTIVLFVIITLPQHSNAQYKEALQFATLSPTIMVIYSSELEHYQKNHFTLSTIGYLGSYIITDSIWKSALIALLLGASKELIYDGLMGRGEPLWDDMKWNTLGVFQGIGFTLSLKI